MRRSLESRRRRRRYWRTRLLMGLAGFAGVLTAVPLISTMDLAVVIVWACSSMALVGWALTPPQQRARRPR